MILIKERYIYSFGGNSEGIQYVDSKFIEIEKLNVESIANDGWERLILKHNDLIQAFNQAVIPLKRCDETGKERLLIFGGRDFNGDIS